MSKSAMKIHVYVTEEKAKYDMNWSVWAGCALVLTVSVDKTFIDPEWTARACAEIVASQIKSTGWGESCLCENANGQAPCGTKPARYDDRAKE